MRIMALAAAKLCGVKSAPVQSNVRTNGCSGLEHGTNQDKTKVSWTNLTFYLRLRRMQSNNHLFLPCVFSIICYPLLLFSLWYLSRSWAQLNSKIRTEQHATASAYNFTQTLVVQSLLRTCLLPKNFKSSMNTINAYLIWFCLMRILMCIAVWLVTSPFPGTSHSQLDCL